jgi:hypothetical protein
VVVLRAPEVRFELKQSPPAGLVDELGQGHLELPDRLRSRRVWRRGKDSPLFEVPVGLSNSRLEAV